MIVQAEIIIKRSRKEVWDTITDIHNAGNIISGVQKIEILDEPANGLVGLKWRETRMYFGKPASVDKWITDAVEKEFFKTRAEMDGFIFLTTMTISENDEGSLLTSSHETKTDGFMAKVKSIPMIFFRGMLKKAISKDLDDIKTAVERNNIQ